MRRYKNVQLNCQYSFFEFRLAEIVSFVLLLIPLIYDFVFGRLGNNPEGLFVYFVLFLFSWLSFVVEHTMQIVFNRDTDTVMIVEKALFQNKYRTIKSIVLSDVERAELQRHSGSKGSSTYNIDIVMKNGDRISPVSISTNNRGYWASLQQQINRFLSRNEAYYTIKISSFAFRIASFFVIALYCAFCFNLWS